MLFQPYLLVVRSSNTSGYVKKPEEFQTRREYVPMSDNSAQASNSEDFKAQQRQI
jgi:hypothetical protein